MIDITSKVLVKKLRPTAILPKFAHGELSDAGADLYAAEDVRLRGMAPTIVKCGFAMALPLDTHAEVRPRSGLALHGVTVWNAPGTIDAGYRGEVGVIMLSLHDYEVRAGDRIAQMVVMEHRIVGYEEVAELSDTERGEGGFGSSGR